jgi:hypothetical protein
MGEKGRKYQPLSGLMLVHVYPTQLKRCPPLLSPVPKLLLDSPLLSSHHPARLRLHITPSKKPVHPDSDSATYFPFPHPHFPSTGPKFSSVR